MKLNISDAATTAEITAGTATNKYITPAGLKVELGNRTASFGWKLLILKRSGTSYTFPDLFNGKAYKIGIIIVGGGGGGGAACGPGNAAGAGGGSGYAKQFIVTVVPGTSCSYSIGSGGVGGNVNSATSISVNGLDGNSSTFTYGGKTYTVLGGKGGKAAYYSDLRYVDGSNGGQGSSCMKFETAYAEGLVELPYGGKIVQPTNGHPPGSTDTGCCWNYFENCPLLYAGGFAQTWSDGAGAYYEVRPINYEFNGVSSPGTYDSSNPTTPTIPGAGGGGKGYYSSATISVKAASGANGGLYIYYQGN